MPANYLDEHQFAQFGEHAFASGALVGRFHHRHADELAKPALIATLRDAGLDDRWQIVEERIERLSVAGKEAADEPGGSRSVSPKVDEEGQLWSPSADLSRASDPTQTPPGGLGRAELCLSSTCEAPRLAAARSAPRSPAQDTTQPF